jgi:hypothetical protein
MPTPLQCGQRITAMIHRVLRDTAFNMQESVARANPIWTGRSKSSWNVNENLADPSSTPELGPDRGYGPGAPGASSLTEGQAMAVSLSTRSQVGLTPTKIVISNNVEYIEILEYGGVFPDGSRYVGKHFVNANVAALPIHFSNAVAKHRIS